jgi:uncharacterized cupin superfamily protein
MKITHQAQAIGRKREDGTSVFYYIFKEYEVHYGELQPGVVQPWHHHQKITEALYIIEGQVALHYFADGKKVVKTVTKGDLVEVEDTPHTFVNVYDKVCRMIAFRFVPTGKDQRQVIKNDKVVHPELD